MPTIIISSAPGKVATDFAFALYNDGVAQDASGLTVTELTVDAIASNYQVNGLSDASAGEVWTLTWNDGIQRGVRRWPLQPSTPPNIVLPLRETGVVLADLDPTLYLDAVEVSSSALTLTELADPFDYVLSGLPAPATGSIYTLAYKYGAIYFTESWPDQVAGVNTALPSSSATSIMPHLLDCMSDTLLAQFVVNNEYGAPIPSGSALAIPCYLEGGNRLVRDITGNEVVSSVQAYLGGSYDLTVNDYRYTLPSRFIPSDDLRAIGVTKANDENGAHHEVVLLP